MEIKNVKVYGLEESILRSGYPMTTGDPIDINDIANGLHETINLDNNIQRAEKLAKVKSGTGHDNFLKGVIVQFDLRYPEYFSPQLQRYNWIDIVSSQSKMHKITSRNLTKNDFIPNVSLAFIDTLNKYIYGYNNTKDSIQKSEFFKNIIANLPSGYLKWMGISTNYLQLKTIYNQRKNHKLDEWKYFCKQIELLPLSNLITQN